MSAPALYLAIIPVAVMFICFLACYVGKPSWCMKPDPNNPNQQVVNSSKALSLCFLLPLAIAAIIGFFWHNAPEPSA
jgi:UDP-N-acetylmuramyl pentapeptide phosphotransferase/UDP-N-acetylglucosamine-1-phosphate transferase